MAGLTPTEITQAVALIREINRTGVTVVVIEHIMRAITGVSDRILVMHHGRRIAEDEPDRVLSDPHVIANDHFALVVSLENGIVTDIHVRADSDVVRVKYQKSPYL